uniref:Uncharacterized protein n=1 Tax=Rhizophagus irregularis (strain DAOM 181602 / DAOM 197198 / MUCL 43194) TaxID=747089 RepID=U9T6M8_RHIID
MQYFTNSNTSYDQCKNYQTEITIDLEIEKPPFLEFAIHSNVIYEDFFQRDSFPKELILQKIEDKIKSAFIQEKDLVKFYNWILDFDDIEIPFVEAKFVG